MRRIVATGVVVALLMGLAGCGGGPELGVPADAGLPKPIDLSQKFAATTKTRDMKVAKRPTVPIPR